MHARAVQHHVSRKCDVALCRLEEVSHTARAVALCLDTTDFMATPYEVVHFLKAAIDADRMDRRTDVAGRVHRKPVTQSRLHFSPGKWSFKKYALGFRNSDLRVE